MAATPDETLAEERERRTKAGATAIGAGVLAFAGSLLVLAASSDFPVTRLLDTLRSSLGVADGTGPGPLSRVVLYFHDNLALVAAARLVPAIATATAGYALVMLYRSIKARDPDMGKVPLIAVISGSVLTVVAALMGTVSLVLDVNDFAGAARQTEDAARDLLRSPFTSVALQLTALGTAVTGVGLLLTARHAMRVGLLTRFMGVLGMIVGALFLIPQLEGSLPFVRIFWLLALGVLFLHRWPRMPPAWVTGEAHPWPTQQELREQRAAAQADRTGGGLEEKLRRPRRDRAEPPETPAPEPPKARPHSSSKKKRRKRR